MSYLKTLATAGGDLMRAALAPLYQRPANERGARVPTDVAMARFYRQFAMSTEVREKIILLRDMEARDGRVKRIHNQVAGDTIRGGLVMQFTETSSSETLRKAWMGFAHRLRLDQVGKLKSDARGLVCEGNLPLQMVLAPGDKEIAAAVRMPAETIVPVVDDGGRFADPMRAYEQRDVMTGRVMATFAAYQLQLGRFDPLSFDDMGEMGRPLLDASVETWRKLVMTEEDLVIRRRQRAPLRMAHVLEGADEATLNTYRQTVEGEKGLITTDFYLSRKGSVTAIQGDAKLNEIEDVVHLMDCFFAGSPLPKGLMGFTNGLSRDVLEDLKRGYYDQVDEMQDALAWEYEQAFRLNLLFKGIVAGPEEFRLRASTRRTETPNQVADLGLKLMGLGLPPPLVWEEMGYDPVAVLAAVDAWAKRADPYPGAGVVPVPGLPGAAPAAPTVKVTPGNARKGESATAVGVPGSNGGEGRG